MKPQQPHINTYSCDYSETGKVRSKMKLFISKQMNGIDIGFGGDPIIPEAVTIDVGCSLARGNYPTNLKGDGAHLTWFQDNSLDYVYSSHLLEDYANPEPPLTEWIRVLKPNGLLILNLPDQKRFLEYCRKYGGGNADHKNDEMSLAWMKAYMARKFPQMRPIYEQDVEDDDYNFLIIFRKRESNG